MADRLYTSSEADEVLSALRFETKLEKATLARMALAWVLRHGSMTSVLIGASRLPPKVFMPLNILGAIVWALLFTTLGYLGGEAIGPWLHHLDGHLKHAVWLILAVVLVLAAHWWLKRREAQRKE